MTSDDKAHRPQSMPAVVWDWVEANLPNMPPFVAETPLSTVVLATLHQAKNNAGPTPDEVLRGWSHLLHDSRRHVNQAERAFIEEARVAEWADDQIREALLLPADIDLDARVDELNAMVVSQNRPPVT